MRRLAGLAIVVVVLALAAAWFIDALRPDRPVIAYTTRSEVDAPEAQPALNSPQPVRVEETAREAFDPSDYLVELRALGYDDAESLQATEWQPPLPPGPLLEGVLVVVDAEGRRSERTSGWFGEVRGLGTNRPAEGARIDVHDGRFSFRHRPGEKIVTSIARLDGRLATFDEDRVVPGDARPFELVARWLPPLRLHVVEAAIGPDLDGITVVQATGNNVHHDLHPGDFKAADIRVKAARSPVPLEPKLRPTGSIGWNEKLWVGRSGSAWKLVEVDFSRGGDVEVQLEPGSELEVRLVGDLSSIDVDLEPRREHESKSPIVRLRRVRDPAAIVPDVDELVSQAERRNATRSAGSFPGRRRPTATELREQAERFAADRRMVATLGHPCAEKLPTREGMARFAGFPLGRWIVTVEIGRSVFRPRYLARGEVTLAAGERRTITLELPTVAATELVPLAGRVVFAPAWGRTSLSLDVEQIEARGTLLVERQSITIRESKPREDGLCESPFEFEAIPAGLYFVSAGRFGIGFVLDTGPNGRRDVELRIGEPSTVVIEPVDARSGGALGIGGEAVALTVCCEPATFFEGHAKGSQPSWYQKSGKWEARLAAGEVELSLKSTHYQARALLTIEPGDSRVKLPVTVRSSILLRVEPGSDDLAWRDSIWNCVEVKTAAGIRVDLDGEWHDGGLLLFVEAPGRYHVSFDPQDGFHPIEPFEVDVRWGELIEHSISLVPKKE